MTRKVSILLIVICIGAIGITAQDATTETCAAIVQRAVEITAENCEGTGRNQACYGNVLIDATASEDADDFKFNEAGDKTDIADIDSLRLSSSVDGSFVWGIANMYVQANLPDSSRENLQIVLFGNVTMDNAGTNYEVPVSAKPLQFPDTEADDETTAEETEPTATPSPSPTPEPIHIDVTSTGNLNLRGGPGTTFNVVGSLTNGQTVTTIGRNAAGDWLLLDLEGEAAWVYAPLVTVDADVTTLDVVETVPAATTTDNSSATNSAAELVGADVTTLEPLQVIDGELSFAIDDKEYTFLAEAGNRVQIRLEAITDGDFMLEIKDDEGEIIAIDDDSGDGLNPYISTTDIPATGKYTVRTRLLISEQFEGTHKYRMIMNLLPPPEFVSTQGFFINTEREDRPCGESIDSGVLIQTPEGEGEIAIVVNEVVIDLGSTAYIRTTDTAMIAGILEGKGAVSSNGNSATVPEGAEIVIPFVGSTTGTYQPDNIQPYNSEQFEALPIENLNRQITPAPPWNGITEGIWEQVWDIKRIECPNANFTYDTVRHYRVLNGTSQSIFIGFWKAIPVGNNNYTGSNVGPMLRRETGAVIGSNSSMYEIEVISPTEIRGTAVEIGDFNDGVVCHRTNTFTLTYVEPLN